jgi:hypothetical protein
MLRIILGLFMALHGLVHLLYVGQSARFFELKPGMVWPDGSWAFSKLLGDGTTRGLASVFLVLAAAGFIASGAGALFNLGWWRGLVVGVAVFSTLIFLLFWDGGMQNLDGKGVVAILINLAILAVVLVWKPSL